MPGHIHGLVQVKFSILVEHRVQAGRKGVSEGLACCRASGSWGTAPSLIPIQSHGNRTCSG